MAIHVRPRMGTLLALSLPPAPGRHEAWIQLTFETASACEREMSRHDDASDVSRVNRRAGEPALVHAPALAATVASARAWAERTGGAFDPTVAPILDVWRRAARRGAPPPRRVVETARQRVGWHGITVRGEHVGLARRGAALDLGAFGKGAALDRIGAALRGARCNAAMLNFGESSLLAIGRPPRCRWEVLLRHPRGGFAGRFALRDRACSTSAALGAWARIGGRRIGHVADPRSGRPLREPAQVTVLARSAATAEALSTALLVLGRSALADAARRFDIDVCWIDGRGVWTSPWFPLQPV